MVFEVGDISSVTWWNSSRGEAHNLAYIIAYLGNINFTPLELPSTLDRSALLLNHNCKMLPTLYVESIGLGGFISFY